MNEIVCWMNKRKLYERSSSTKERVLNVKFLCDSFDNFCWPLPDDFLETYFLNSFGCLTCLVTFLWVDNALQLAQIHLIIYQKNNLHLSMRWTKGRVWACKFVIYYKKFFILKSFLLNCFILYGISFRHLVQNCVSDPSCEIIQSNKSRFKHPYRLQPDTRNRI